MVPYTNLSCEHNAIADLHTSANTDLGNYYTIFAYYNVMAYLDEVIYLCSGTYNCVSCRRPVYGNICADLHIVFNDYSADLRYLIVHSLFKYISKTIRAYDSARMYYYFLA